jgi:hypothetical protein
MGGTVEMDEAFFGSFDEGGKRGRGAKKTAVMVSVSLTSEGKPGFARMNVVDAVNGAAAFSFAERTVAKGSEIRTDGLHLQRYFDKFCYRSNRRWIEGGVFSWFVLVCAFSYKITYHELIG